LGLWRDGVAEATGGSSSATSSTGGRHTRGAGLAEGAALRPVLLVPLVPADELQDLDETVPSSEPLDDRCGPRLLGTSSS